ncbi:hypothetical protein M3Y96_00925900 [Aphelenchoides besseyi]|nr:hypothetical protein M3Y96_00925900 [Aphelenchoides besseyi]
MFVRQLCFFVVFAIIGLADDHQGFEAQGDSSATLDLSKFDYGNATFQLTGSTLAIGISNPSSEIEDATKATFTFGSCSVVAVFGYNGADKYNFFGFPNGGGSVNLPAEATYDGSKLSIKDDNGKTVEKSCSSTEFKADGSLAVAVKSSKRFPVVLTFKASFPKQKYDSKWIWITVSVMGVFDLLCISCQYCEDVDYCLSNPCKNNAKCKGPFCEHKFVGNLTKQHGHDGWATLIDLSLTPLSVIEKINFFLNIAKTVNETIHVIFQIYVDSNSTFPARREYPNPRLPLYEAVSTSNKNWNRRISAYFHFDSSPCFRLASQNKSIVCPSNYDKMWNAVNQLHVGNRWHFSTFFDVQLKPKPSDCYSPINYWLLAAIWNYKCYCEEGYNGPNCEYESNAKAVRKFYAQDNFETIIDLQPIASSTHMKINSLLNVAQFLKKTFNIDFKIYVDSEGPMIYDWMSGKRQRLNVKLTRDALTYTKEYNLNDYHKTNYVFTIFVYYAQDCNGWKKTNDQLACPMDYSVAIDKTRRMAKEDVSELV